MAPFAFDTGARDTRLFVPHGSALSQLEVLTQGLGLDADERQQDESCGKSAVEGRMDPACPLQRAQEDSLQESMPSVDGTQGHSSSSKLRDCETSMHWVLARSPEELAHQLKVQQQFRAFVIGQRNSHSNLSISKDLFESLCLVCGISEHFQDILTFFGSRDLEVEVAAPRLHYAPLSWLCGLSPGTGFECMYGLRFVEPNNRGDPRRMYSLRQMAVCNKVEADPCLATWVFVAPPPGVVLSLKERIESKSLPLSSPFHMHVLLFGFAVSSWRPYLVHLAQEVHQHANTVLVATPTGNGPICLSECGDLQRLKQLGDEMLDTAISLSTSRDAIQRLIEGYIHYATRVDTKKIDTINNREDDIHHQLTENLREVGWLLQQTDGLRQKLLGTSQLVSSFAALGNGLSLEDLGKEAREENSQIHELTKKSAQDAAAVKVLTIMMLVYLPATVVSNFFSTSFVDSDSSSGSPKKLVVLANWWIFVVISVPLTIVTLYLWWVLTAHQVTGMYPCWWKRITSLRPRLSSMRDLPADEENNVVPVGTINTINIDSEKRTLTS